jgi:hypothetical protein
MQPSTTKGSSSTRDGDGADKGDVVRGKEGSWLGVVRDALDEARITTQESRRPREQLTCYFRPNDR